MKYININEKHVSFLLSFVVVVVVVVAAAAYYLPMRFSL